MYERFGGRIRRPENFLLHEARKSSPSLPNGWKVGLITDLAHLDPSTPKAIPDDEMVSFVPMESVLEGGGLSDLSERPYGDVKKGYTYFEDGDVIFAKITPCMENGKGALAVGLCNGRAMGSTEYYVFRPKEIEDTEFVYHILMSTLYRRRAERWMQGSAGQRRVPKDFFNRRPIVIPDPESRVRIGSNLADINKRKIRILSQISNIRSILALTLCKFMSEGTAHV